MPGILYPIALSARVGAAVCADSGVEIAHWLLLQNRTTGVNTGEGRALVERALRGRSVAEELEGDPILALQAEPQANPTA